MSKNKTHEEFLKQINLKTISYKILGTYEGVKTPILIKNKFGKCLMLPDNLLQGKCPTIKAAINKNKYFINEAKGVHEDKYTYEKFNYKDAKILSTITCSIHGDFEQTPNNHLRGKGCGRCALEICGGHSKSDFIKSSKGRDCIFYILKLFNENEEFYKIGITSNPITTRFHSTKMPYSYEILQEIKGTAEEIWELELKNKRELKEFSYKPKIKFSGQTECFINVNLLLNN